MQDKDIQELIMIVTSVELNKNKYDKAYEFKPGVIIRCKDFCKYHNINVTHGSPYKELRHKYYYYLDKYIKNLLDNKTDLYKLRENHVITDKEIVDRILRKG